MTVKQLKEQLAGVPDDAVVLVPGDDFDYRLALVDLVKVRGNAGPDYWKHFSDLKLNPGTRVCKALLFS